MTQSRHTRHMSSKLAESSVFFELPGGVLLAQAPTGFIILKASLGRLFAKRPEFAIGWCVVERDLIKLGHQNSAVRTLQYSINSFDSKQF